MVCGLAFATLISSATLFAGNAGCTTKTRGTRAITPTVSKERLEYGSLGYKAKLMANEDASIRTVYPSGALRATADAAICPATPGLLSVMTDWPSDADISGPTSLAIRSAPPPGG